MPTGSPISTFDPLTGQAITVPNTVQDFGWEYVWHCHMLSHEEMDFMRPMAFMAAPQDPSSLVARASSGANAPASITLTWSETTTTPVNNYTLQRATDAAFTQNVTTVDTIASSAASYTDTTVAETATYYYRLRAESTVGYSDWTAAASATAPLLAPANLAGTAASTSVVLSWTNQSAVNTGYTIQRATNAGFTGAVTLPAITNPATTTSTDSNLTPGATYWYRIRADKTGSTSSIWVGGGSITLPAPPPPSGLAAPSGVAATYSRGILGTPVVTVRWTNGAAYTALTLQRSTSSTFTAGTITNLPVARTQTSFTDTLLTGIANNRTYYYRLQGRTATQTSSWSNVAGVTTTLNAPPPPLAAPVMAVAPAQVTVNTITVSLMAPGMQLLSLQSQTGVRQFVVQISTDKSFRRGTVTAHIAAKVHRYTAKGLKRNTAYYLRVQAVTTKGTTPWSSTLTVRTKR